MCSSDLNSYDVIMRRGSISGTTISFESEVTVLDGTSASDKYVAPHVALDANSKVWTAAFNDLGDVGDRYYLTARRTTNDGSQALSFDSATSLGKPSVTVAGVALVPMTGSSMLLVVSGDLGPNGNTNAVPWEYNGTSWSLAGTGDRKSTRLNSSH